MGSLSEKAPAVQQSQNDAGSDVDKVQENLGEGGYFVRCGAILHVGCADLSLPVLMIKPPF